MRRIGPVAPDMQMADGLDACRNRELGDLFGGIWIVATSPRNADQQRALGAIDAPSFDLEDCQDSVSAARFTGRAGTTVEIACL